MGFFPSLFGLQVASRRRRRSLVYFSSDRVCSGAGQTTNKPVWFRAAALVVVADRSRRQRSAWCHTVCYVVAPCLLARPRDDAWFVWRRLLVNVSSARPRGPAPSSPPACGCVALLLPRLLQFQSWRFSAADERALIHAGVGARERASLRRVRLSVWALLGALALFILFA